MIQSDSERLQGGPGKAFENQEFLQTPPARPIRILSEYLYPQDAFQKKGVTDTVVFFGSARIHSPDEAISNSKDESGRSRAQNEYGRYYTMARELARAITEWSLQKAEKEDRRFLVCTGGGPGIMEASNRGAMEAGGQSIGLNIELQAETGSNPYVSPELNFDFHYFFTRKYWFLYYARMLIVFPGGFGTLDELFEILTLQQTKNIAAYPVILVGKEFWSRLVDFDFLEESGMISGRDRELIRTVDSTKEALMHILPHLEEELARGPYRKKNESGPTENTAI